MFMRVNSKCAHQVRPLGDPERADLRHSDNSIAMVRATECCATTVESAPTSTGRAEHERTTLAIAPSTYQ